MLYDGMTIEQENQMLQTLFGFGDVPTFPTDAK